MNGKHGLNTLALTLFLSLAYTQAESQISSKWHITQESYYYEGTMAIGELPIGYNDLFAGSGECVQCHNSMVNTQGESVSIISDWRSTMMANAARDPFWRAKVSHEGLVNPQHKEALENVCTRCHAPVGNENAHYNGQDNYSISDMTSDPLALDGVQCSVCHQITDESLGNYSGTFLIGTEKIIWGPYTNPFANPMIEHTGYTPAFGDQITKSELCASCHTLITNSVDNNGNPTGNQFVEQAVYHEWLNSDFPDNGQTCQSCHVPQIDDPVVISTMPPWLDGRTPFGMHHFAGANTFMLKMLKDNGDELGVTANDVQFDSTIARNYRMLQNNSLSTNLEVINRSLDSVFIDLNLVNMAGHKFPAGYPSRRVFIELVVTSDNDTIFHNGKFDSNGDLIFEDVDYETHHNMINTEDQVQIYELVMGDINYQVTTVLERANFPLKDNRIPPAGFSTNFSSYDTVKIVGDANADSDFNNDNGSEGSGTDIVHFHIPTYGNTGLLNIISNVYYQTVSPRWLDEMFSFSSDEIDSFKSYYNNADKTPVLVSSMDATSNFTTIHSLNSYGILLYPNPTNGNITIVSDTKIESAVMFSIDGKIINDNILTGLYTNSITISNLDLAGLYFIVIKGAKNKWTQKVIFK